MDNIFYVYLHRRKTDNKVFYVGKGKGKRAYRPYGRNPRWNNTANKHGFSVEIVFDNLLEQEAFSLEIDTIKEMQYLFPDTLCNLTNGGEGSSGYKWSDEMLARHPSLKLKGTTQPRAIVEKRRLGLIGKRPSKELIEKMKLLQSSRYASIRVFAAMKKVLLGKCLLPYTKLSQITGIEISELCKSGKMSAEAVAKSIKKRSGKPSWNSGKKLPQFSGANNSCSDNTVYNFIRVEDGLTFTGTRYELAARFELSLQQLGRLFYSKPRKVSLGWSLIKE